MCSNVSLCLMAISAAILPFDDDVSSGERNKTTYKPVTTVKDSVKPRKESTLQTPSLNKTAFFDQTTVSFTAESDAKLTTETSKTTKHKISTFAKAILTIHDSNSSIKFATMNTNLSSRILKTNTISTIQTETKKENRTTPTKKH